MIWLFFADELGYLVDSIVSDDKISTFDKRPGDMTLEVSCTAIVVLLVERFKANLSTPAKWENMSLSKIFVANVANLKDFPTAIRNLVSSPHSRALLNNITKKLLFPSKFIIDLNSCSGEAPDDLPAAPHPEPQVPLVRRRRRGFLRPRRRRRRGRRRREEEGRKEANHKRGRGERRGRAGRFDIF